MHLRAQFEHLEIRRHLAAQAYDWNPVTEKANGYINGIVFAKTGGAAYIHTDIGGAYRLDPASNRWIPLNYWQTSGDGPVQNGGAQTIAVDPTDPNRVYMVAGTYQSSAAFLRSSDQGRTWQRTTVNSIQVDGNGWGRNVGERLMVDPNLPSTLYYGAQDYSATASGLWKSTDYGATWNKVNTFTATGDLWNGTYANANGVGVGFVLLDKSSGSAGSATAVMYAGVATVASTSSKVYLSSDGGATWNAIANQPAITLTPNRAVLSPDGSTMYIAYSDQSGPYAATTGALYKVTNPNSQAATWTNVTPSVGAYSAVNFDPTNPNTVYAAVFDRYPDNIYRTTNAGTSWTPLTPESHRNDTSAAYASSLQTHWLTDLEIDPTNNNIAIYNTGYGLYRTTNLTAATPTWSFYNDGFEQAAVLEIATANTGAANVFTAIGDRDGFRHVFPYTTSPSTGRFGQTNNIAVGTDDDVDVAYNDANYLVRVVRTTPFVQFSVNNGVNWAWMPSTGSSGSTSGGGNIAISADGLYTVYEPGGTGRQRYSVRTGSTWGNWVSTSITNQPTNGAKIVADLSAAHTFYAYAGATVSQSTDGGQTWTIMTTTAPSNPSWIRAVPGQAGHLLASFGGNGVWRSINAGATWTRLASGVVTNANQVGVGAGATPGAYPSIFVGGTVNGLNGFFRSDDQGATWVMVSDLAHQFGAVDVIQGDYRVYGRLYVGTNGEGTQYADIHQGPTTLPAGWSTQDIGAPANAGSAGSSAAGSFELVGGGAGISGASDQFRFAYTTLNGDGSIVGQVIDVPNTSPTNLIAKAGVMIRSTLAANSPMAFVGLTPGSVNGAVFSTRLTTNASASTTSAPGVWPPYWVKLTRVGDQFMAYRSPDGINWTPIGAAQTIAMGTSVFVGLGVTSSDPNQVNISHFQNVSVAAVDTTPPAVNSSNFDYSHSPNTLNFVFSEDVFASLNASDLTVTAINSDGSPGAAVTVGAPTYNAVTNTATFALPTPLADGNYRATLLSAGVTDAAGNPLPADVPLDFFSLAADANHDRIVDVSDLGVLATNWQASGKTFADGDFNYDGLVDVTDLGILATNWQVSVAAPSPPIAALTFASPTSSIRRSPARRPLADDVLA
jgi:hypothetical protein